MTKLAAAFLAGAIASASPSLARADVVDFRGGGWISNFTEACVEVGWGPRTLYVNARYRPPRLGDNGPNTRITFLTSHYATSYLLPEGNLTNRFKPVRGGGTGAGTFFFSQDPQMRITLQQPRNVRPRTPSVRLRGQIRDFDNTPGCRVNFDISVTQRP